LPQSAGLLMYRLGNAGLELFLAHPGGPYFRNKDEGAWTIPKGMIEPGEDPIETARREFTEETGLPCPGEMLPLETIRQKGGKTVHGWAFAGDWDQSQPIRSNLFELEWPPRSGQKQSFPEVDRAAFFTPEQARRKIILAQSPFIDRLVALLD